VSNPIQAPESAQTWAASSLGPRQRALAWERLGAEQFDVVVIGGGVVGSGCALDAATRGLKVALVEARDFASGTSSRSSKMFHGGLRYLEQLEFGLVREALFERELTLTKLAPHLVKPLPFLFPLTKRWWERPYVAAGIFLYDQLGGAKSLPPQKHFFKAGALRLAPGLKRSSLIGGIRYYDTVVDDARHTMTVARTAAHYGAVVRASTQVVSLLREGDRVIGVRVHDSENGSVTEVRGHVVVNATGFPGAWAQALDIVRDGGTVIEVGAFVDMGTETVNPASVCGRNLCLLGVGGEDLAAYEGTLALLARHQASIPFADMVSHRFVLTDAPRAMALALDADASAKVLITPGG